MMLERLNLRWGVGLIIAGLLLALPWLVRSYYLSLAIEVLIFAIFAMSLDLLLGYTGLPSFGHAAFFGLGAYIAAYLTSSSAALGLPANLFLLLPLVLVGSAGVALLIGSLALRTTGLYFLMITLAFAQMLFSIAVRWSSVTGGTDGLTGVPRPDVWMYQFNSRESFYYLVLFFFGLTWYGLHRLIHSPFGWTLRGIRENERRLQALGYRTYQYKLAVFGVAGAVAGLAGMLLAQFFRYASPDTLYWTVSGEALIMLIVGGVGTLGGPVLGAGLVRVLPTLASSYTDRWQTLLGGVFILFVLFAPGGIIGLLRQWASRGDN